LSESQKYGSKNYVQKEAKGEVKQNAWCEQVQRAIEYVTEPLLKELLQNIQGYNNIPRKEAKFINFLTNSCRIRDVKLCKMAWAAISAEALKLKEEGEVKKVNGEGHKISDTLSSVSFKWKSTIKRKLREAGGEMKV
uniref:Zf-LYAR domain-containing protein n=1 Tax=Angiostrongylus cantonensis TaxID=6313 RepID=A0A0K0DH18_ANGCA